MLVWINVLAFMGLSLPILSGGFAFVSALTLDSASKQRILSTQYSLDSGHQYQAYLNYNRTIDDDGNPWGVDADGNPWMEEWPGDVVLEVNGLEVLVGEDEVTMMD